MISDNKFKMKSTLLFILIAAISFMLLSAGSAHAIATIRLDDGNTILDIGDGGLNDSNGNSGVVVYNGSIGNWTINVTTGITSGSSIYPVLDLNSINVSSSAGGTLDIYFSETGFGPTGNALFSTQVGGVTDGTLLATSYLDGSNTLFGTATTLGTLGPYQSDSFSGNTWTSFDPTDPYSLTNRVTITHVTTQTSSFNMKMSVVPEPVSSTLFIVGAATLGFRRFRKSRMA